MWKLFRERRFLPYFLTQFLGAFNDNVFKNGLLLLVTFGLVEQLDETPRKIAVTAVSGVFILPFLLFSAFAGQFADKFRKAWLIRQIKLAEVVIMLLAAVGFFLQSLPLLMVCLFLMGAQSAAFGPLKYSILPEELGDRELLVGNGWVQAGTFSAILFGTLLGGVLYKVDPGTGLLAVSVVAFALAGYAASAAIPGHRPPSEPTLRLRFNPAVLLRDVFRDVCALRDLRFAIIGIAWFWFMGSAVLSQFSLLARDYLRGDEWVATFLLALMTVGIAISSPLCSRLLGGRIRFGSVWAGGSALGIFLALTALALVGHRPEGGVDPEDLRSLGLVLQDPGSLPVVLAVCGLALSSGFFTVPLYTWIQRQSEPAHRARTIAASNFANALLMVASALYFMIGYSQGLELPLLLGLVAAAQILVTGLVFLLSGHARRVEG